MHLPSTVVLRGRCLGADAREQKKTRVSYLVLDEADRMLDKGFENDIRNIIGRTVQGSERQTLMCECPRLCLRAASSFSSVSATWPDAVRRLAATFQRDPVRVTVGSDDLTANSRVEQGTRSPLVSPADLTGFVCSGGSVR